MTCCDPSQPVIRRWYGRSRDAPGTVKEAATRKSLIGSGDRSERIRTYNFPQGRVTDHRINLTLYKIDQIMDGDLNELTTVLAQEFQAELLFHASSEKLCESRRALAVPPRLPPAVFRCCTAALGRHAMLDQSGRFRRHAAFEGSGQCEF